MIRHVVLLSLKNDAKSEETDAIFTALEALKNKAVLGIISFSFGPIKMSGAAAHITHGFVMDFIDVAARDKYLTDADHEIVKGMVGKALSGPLEKSVIAFDYPKDSPLTPRGQQKQIYRHVLLFNDEKSVIAELKSKTKGSISFSAGPYTSGEGLNQSYKFGCVVAFNDEKISTAFKAIATADLYLDYVDNGKLVYQKKVVHEIAVAPTAAQSEAVIPTLKL